MRKYLLPNTGRYYKTSLHCHTTVSDGNLTPEQLKDEYKKQGYSVVAFTDHELIVPHSELRDEDFLPITSYEISTTQDKGGSYAKTYHLNIYFRNPGTTTSKTFSEKHVSKKEHMQCRITDEMRAAQGRPREYTKDYIQWVVDTAREEGAIVSYNHPVWSLQSKDDYSGIKGFFGVEWHNTGCVRIGLPDTMQPVYDLLAEGERKCYPLATDDCHALVDVGKGWAMVNADALEYGKIFDALERGDFYSSTGPEINELYIEDDCLVVRCSPVKKVEVQTGHRRALFKNASDGELLTEASFSLEAFYEQAKEVPEGRAAYLQVNLKDEMGNYARTRAYFIDEFM